MANKKVLIISYHFPPIGGSSGYLRTLKFATYLSGLGYTPIILTANSKSYDNLDESMSDTLPKNLLVKRAFALNIKKHLSLCGKYPGFISIPDQFASWIPDAIWQGIRLVKKHKIDLIYSTYPISSAHLIGWSICKITKVPWIADFRDPMWDSFSHFEASQLKARKFIEKKTIELAKHIVCTTKSIRHLLLNRFSSLAVKDITMIPNGFDENDFQGLKLDKKKSGPVRFIHAGLLERIDRDPFHFFEGIRIFVEKEKLSEKNVCFDFYGPNSENMYRKKITELNLNNIVKILDRINYKDVLIEMTRSDALLLFQGPTCDTQIPAKFYEYLRIGKPILAVTTNEGETGQLVNTTKSGEVVNIDNPPKIADVLKNWYSMLREGTALPKAAPEVIQKYSRESQAVDLAQCFNKVLAE